MVEYSSEQLNKTFHALSDPTRRLILQQVGREALTVNDIARQHDMSLAAVSKHLQVLDRAGLISRRKEGRMQWCRLNAGPLAHAHDVIETYRRFWNERLDELDNYLAGRE